MGHCRRTPVAGTCAAPETQNATFVHPPEIAATSATAQHRCPAWPWRCGVAALRQKSGGGWKTEICRGTAAVDGVMASTRKRHKAGLQIFKLPARYPTLAASDQPSGMWRRVRPKEHRHPTRSSRSLGVVYRAAPDPKRPVTSLESCRSTPELTRSAKRHRVE